jgi:hypothetical protein
MFLAGFILLPLAFAMLYFSGVLLDTGDNRHIDVFVFQPDIQSTRRMGRPVPVEELSDGFVRDKLIKKFIAEYFYVAPDAENIALRTKSNSILAAMSSAEVFWDWMKTEAQEITKMADKKILRDVNVLSIIPRQPGNYFEVYYELKTWSRPNDMNAAPETQPGIANIYLNFEKGFREYRGQGQKFDIKKYLEDGGDPAAIFKFRVEKMIK